MTDYINQDINGRYHIEEMIGQGGMGVVYSAKDARLHYKKVAVKQLVIPSDLDKPDRETIAESFEREVITLQALNNAHIPKVSDFFAENGDKFFVMDFIEGDPVSKMIGKPVDMNDLLDIGIGASEALVYLHDQIPPVVHRDVKPGNIIKEKTGIIKLVDFGIAKPFDKKKGTAIGTKGYAAPEQYSGNAEPKSDVYSLAATLVSLALGINAEDNPIDFYQKLAIVEQLGIEPKLAKMLKKAVAKISDRCDSREMLEALQELELQYKNKSVTATNQCIPSLRFRGDFNQFLTALLTRIDKTTGEAKADEPFDAIDIEKYYRDYLFELLPMTSSGYTDFAGRHRTCNLSDLYNEVYFWYVNILNSNQGPKAIDEFSSGFTQLKDIFTQRINAIKDTYSAADYKQAETILEDLLDSREYALKKEYAGIFRVMLASCKENQNHFFNAIDTYLDALSDDCNIDSAYDGLIRCMEKIRQSSNPNPDHVIKFLEIPLETIKKLSKHKPDTIVYKTRTALQECMKYYTIVKWQSKSDESLIKASQMQQTGKYLDALGEYVNAFNCQYVATDQESADIFSRIEESFKQIPGKNARYNALKVLDKAGTLLRDLKTSLTEYNSQTPNDPITAQIAYHGSRMLKKAGDYLEKINKK